MTKEERQQQIEELRGHDAGTGIMEKGKMAIMTSLIEDLEKSINTNSDKSDKLSKAMIGLTIVIALATLALAVIGGLDLWLKFQCR